MGTSTALVFVEKVKQLLEPVRQAQENVYSPHLAFEPHNWLTSPDLFCVQRPYPSTSLTSTQVPTSGENREPLVCI